MKSIFLFFICIFLLGTVSYGQIDYDKFPIVTSKFLINDAHIQKSPKDSFGIGDILIDKGYITRVAKEIKPPVDAYVIEADSAYAYPSFIAGLSHVGIAEPAKKDRPKVKFKGHPPNDVAGVTPELVAKDFVSLKDASIKAMRESGFAIAHAVPRGKMLPGQGSIILLDGEETESIILEDSNSQFLQMKGSGGFYPNTVIGVMAKWRELYRQAHYLEKHQSAYSSKATKSRAKTDKSLEALIPVTKSQQPVFMNTNKPKDIYRGITLKNDLGYNLVLAEIKQGWDQIDLIKKNNIPVLLSTVLPKEQKEKDKKGKKKDKDKKKDEVEEDAETKALKTRKKKSYENHIGQAAAFEAAGIPFGFSFLTAKPKELKKSVNRMMKAGLSKSGALAALTTNPAKILGLSNVGSIESGMMANIFISDKPYFDKDSKIKYTFIEGQLKEIEHKKESKKKGGEADKEMVKSLVGTWKYEVTTPDGNFEGDIKIIGAESIESVTITSEGEENEGEDIELDGKSLGFSFDTNIQGMAVTINMTLEFSEDNFTGDANVGEFGTFPIKGSKSSSPE